MRNSHITTETDRGGAYETEIFDSPHPKSVVVCSHGNGVRRWDGEHFFHNVAAQYPDRVFMLVDQNQRYKDGCKLNDLQVMAGRVQKLVDKAAAEYPGVPLVVVGHSMGCGVTTRLNLDKVDKVIFVAPSAGDVHASLVKKYGPDIVQGKVVKTKDGLTKFLSKEYVQSVEGIVWGREFQRLLKRFKSIYVFEAGDEQIVGEERLAYRDMPFASYTIIPGAKHDIAGEPLQSLFTELDPLL